MLINMVVAGCSHVRTKADRQLHLKQNKKAAAWHTHSKTPDILLSGTLSCLSMVFQAVWQDMFG